MLNCLAVMLQTILRKVFFKLNRNTAETRHGIPLTPSPICQSQGVSGKAHPQGLVSLLMTMERAI